MKKMLCLVLCLVILALSLSACSSDTITETEPATDNATETATDNATETESMQTLPKGRGDIYLVYDNNTTICPIQRRYLNKYYEFVTEDCIKIEVDGDVIYLPLSSIIAIIEN